MQHEQQKYHLIAELLSTLQAEGYPLGTGQQLRVQELLRRLPPDTPIEELPYLLAPVFAHSPKEQAHFYEAFEACRKRTEAFFKATATSAPVEKDHKGKRFRWLIIGLLAALVVPPLVYLALLSHQEERPVLVEPFTVLAGEMEEICLIDTLQLQDFGPPVKYELLYPGDSRLGSFTVEVTPPCFEYAARDSAAGKDSIVVAWINANGRRLQVNYKAIVVLPEEIAESSAEDSTEVVSPVEPQFALPEYTFEAKTYPFEHSPLDFAIPQPSSLRRFLAENFWWLKWGGLLVFTALLLAILFFRAYRRRKLVAEMENNDRPPYAWNIQIEGVEAITFGDDFSYVLNLIRQRTGSEAFQLDIPRTIGATIERGGMPTFQYLERTQPPEYLLLIEQQSARNHRARLLDLLYQVFHDSEVLIERFFYDGDPRICYNEMYPEGIPLAELQQRYSSSRLMMVGYGNALLNKMTGKVAPWAKVLSNWKHRLLLTPRPADSWGKRERRLGGLFVLLPLSIQSLLFWLEELEMEEDARFDAWPASVKEASRPPIELAGPLLPSLQAHFSEPMLKWVAACAIYPALHWDLTLHFGQQLSKEGENLLTVDNLLQLTRLPWFTEGRIPPAARNGLLSWLEKAHPGQLEELRAQLADILQQNPPPSDSAAFEDYRMNVALNQWLTVRDKGRKKELEQEIARLLEAGNDIDTTVVKHLERERSPLDFILPDSWKKYFHPHGLPGLGWRSEWRDVLRWALPLWLPALLLTAWPWQIPLTDCEGVLVDYQANEEENLLCISSLHALGVMTEAHILASIRSDSLPQASAINAQAMLWMLQPGAELYLPEKESSFGASWQWKMPISENSVLASSIAYEAATGSLKLMMEEPAFPTGWAEEYRSNMAVAFYNKGADLYLAGAEFLDLNPAERRRQLSDGLEEWQKIQAGNSELPPEVQQSLVNTFQRLGVSDPDTAALDSLELRFDQLIGSLRERVCSYFQEAALLDSTQFDMEKIRAWCSGESLADTIAQEACYTVMDLSNGFALRSRPLTRAEAAELNKAVKSPRDWSQLPVNRETLIKSIFPGDQLELLEEGPDYYRVRHRGDEGYMVKTYGGEPALVPCAAPARAGKNTKAAGEASAKALATLEGIMLNAADNWRTLETNRANIIGAWPNTGVRWPYSILKPVLNPSILENIIGEPVYLSGPHRGEKLDLTNEESFGRYNPAFLRKLLTTLSQMSKKGLLVKQLQSSYDREFQTVLRTFYDAYPLAANNKEVVEGYLEILDTPLDQRRDPGLYSSAANSYFFDQFKYTPAGRDQLEWQAATRFWVRRTIDGTEDEFYQLLLLTMRTFDPGYLSRSQPGGSGDVSQQSAAQPDSVTLPTLRDAAYDYSQYAKQLQQLGLQAVVRERVYTQKLVENSIVSVFHKGEKIPEANLQQGVRMPKGATLEFVISENTSGHVQVPDLVCKQYAQARFTLSNVGLEVGAVEGKPTDEAYVYRQDPAYEPGRVLNLGQPVNLFLSASLPAGCPGEGRSQLKREVEAIITEYGLTGLQLDFDEAAVREQSAFPGNRVAFLDAVRKALDRLIYDEGDAETLINLVPGRWNPVNDQKGNGQEYLEKVKEILKSSRLALVLDEREEWSQNTEKEDDYYPYRFYHPERGEEIRNNWIFYLDQNFTDHLIWAVVPRDGSRPYSYGFN